MFKSTERTEQVKLTNTANISVCIILFSPSILKLYKSIFKNMLKNVLDHLSQKQENSNILEYVQKLFKSKNYLLVITKKSSCFHTRVRAKINQAQNPATETHFCK